MDEDFDAFMLCQFEVNNQNIKQWVIFNYFTTNYLKFALSKYKNALKNMLKLKLIKDFARHHLALLDTICKDQKITLSPNGIPNIFEEHVWITPTEFYIRNHKKNMLKHFEYKNRKIIQDRGFNGNRQPLNRQR